MTRQPSLRVAFFGSPQFAVPILTSLAESFDVCVVISQPSKAVGRHHTVQETPVSKKAKELAITSLTPAKLSEEPFRQSLLAHRVDIGLVAAYGKILPQWLLDWPTKGMINVHASLLPAYRGASPISAVIADGCMVTGVTMMVMNAKMDEGDILTQYPMDIGPDATTASLSDSLSALATQKIGEVVANYADGRIMAIPQPVTGVSYTKPLTIQDGYIDFDHPPQHLDRLVRAYWPWPSVWGMWRGKRIKLLPHNYIQMEGKLAVPLADFRRGYPHFPLTSI